MAITSSGNTVARQKQHQLGSLYFWWVDRLSNYASLLVYMYSTHWPPSVLTTSFYIIEREREREKVFMPELNTSR